MLCDRISRFLTHPASEDFNTLALDAFRFQVERIPPLRALCERRGIRPETLADWREIPLVPTTAFKSLELKTEPAREIFRSSGTTAGENRRSTHHHPYPDLYRQVIDASFSPHVWPTGGRPPILSLIPGRKDAPDSSLSFMAEHILSTQGAADSLVAFGPRGVDFLALRSWCSARQRDRRPALILATALALHQALERLERLELRFRLPAGTVIFETGGFKGRTGEVERADLLRRAEERLGVPPAFVVREYGMTELTSQCYTEVLQGGDPDLFVAPHWLRVRILDPVSLAEAPSGTSGLISLLDLGNLGSALHLLTEDLGVASGKGFSLQGRASGAELRGCSLTAEELAGA